VVTELQRKLGQYESEMSRMKTELNRLKQQNKDNDGSVANPPGDYIGLNKWWRNDLKLYFFPFVSFKLVHTKSLLPRSCQEALTVEPTMLSGNYYVDPDGTNMGDDPIYVYCNASTG